jgi:hypothetical protein
MYSVRFSLVPNNDTYRSHETAAENTAPGEIVLSCVLPRVAVLGCGEVCLYGNLSESYQLQMLFHSDVYENLNAGKDRKEAAVT